jgi:hypothetical protein
LAFICDLKEGENFVLEEILFGMLVIRQENE